MILTIVLVIRKRNLNKYTDAATHYIGATVITVLAYVFSIMILSFIVDIKTQERYVKVQKQKIISLDRNQDINGEFVFGSGSITSQRMYVVMKKYQTR